MTDIKTKNGASRFLCLKGPFIRHYEEQSDEVIPWKKEIATQPVVGRNDGGTGDCRAGVDDAQRRRTSAFARTVGIK